MVRKSVTLSSLDGLNVSVRTKNYLKNAFSSLQELVWYGRHMAYLFAEGLRKREKSYKSTLELVDALEKAGFIRQDITANSFSIGRLYRSIYKDVDDNASLPRGIDDFGASYWKVGKKHIEYSVDYKQANQNYEEFKNPSTDLIKQVDVALKLSLDSLEYEVMASRYGFEDGKMQSLALVARKQHVTSERIHQIESRALRKLKLENRLPSILKPSDEQDAEVNGIIAEIELIHQDPLFQRESMLMNRLQEIAKSPYSCAEKAKKYLNISDHNGIESLGLSPRTYNCLKRAGINTVNDVVNLPPKDWRKVRYLGRKSLEEIVEKTRLAGFVHFEVNVKLS